MSHAAEIKNADQKGGLDICGGIVEIVRYGATIRSIYRERALLSKMRAVRTGPGAAVAGPAFGGVARVLVPALRQLARETHSHRAGRDAGGPGAFAADVIGGG